MKLPSKNPKPLSSGLYKIDVFNSKPIFSVSTHKTKKNWLVNSWEEAFAIHGNANLSDINPSYISSLISNVQTTKDSPYLRIKRLPRGNFVQLFDNGDFKTFPYDPFKDGVTLQKEDELHKVIDYIFQNNLKKELPNDASSIGCELSSGLDSNAIVGGLIKGVGVDPSKVFTWSHDGNGEGPFIKEFYKFHNLKQGNYLLNKDKYKKINIIKSLKDNLFIYGMPHQLGGNTNEIKYFNECACKVLFSGFGGDQGISHNGNNLATDFISNLEIIQFFNWMDNPIKGLKTLIGRTYGFMNHEWQENKFSKKASKIKTLNPLVEFLTEKGKEWLIPHLSEEFIDEIDTYSPLHHSIKKRCTSEWVALRVEEEKRLAAKYGIKKCFPFLEETIIGTLLNQNPKYFAEKYGKGRLIHRKAFAEYLPERLRTNPKKDRDMHHNWIEIEKEKQKNFLFDLIEFSQNWNSLLSQYWNLNELKKVAINTHENIHSIDISRSSRIIKSMRIMNKLSCWFSELE